MGWMKKIKRQITRPYGTFKSVKGRLSGDSSRGEAADQLLQKKEVPVSRQAGNGQIKYTGETWE